MRARLALFALFTFILAGCGGSQTYRTTDARLGTQSLQSTVRLEDRSLTTTTRAGGYPIRQVRLRLADGTIVEPSVSTIRPSQRRGGLPIGIGVGTGIGGNVGVGVGTGVRVGGKVVPGDRDARFLDVDPQQQLFTLLIEIDSDPTITVPLPLGKEATPGSTTTQSETDGRVETWKLPDGTTRTFRVTQAGDDVPRYDAVE